MKPEPDTLEEEKQEPEHSGVDTSKLSEDFQQEVEGIMQGATIPELDFIISEATGMKKSMGKSQNKAGLGKDSFSTKDMPE